MAQPDTTNTGMPDATNQVLLENMAEDAGSEEGGFEFDTQFENLEGLRKKPIDINTATPEELAGTGLFSELQTRALQEYRRQYGDLLTLYELKSVPLFDMEFIKQILPYITVSGKLEEKKVSFWQMFARSRRDLFVRWQRTLEQREGYTDPEYPGQSRYLGSPDRLYARVTLKYRDKMKLGVTMEKDPGEEFFKGSNKKGFDFYSFHFQLNNPTKWLKTLVLGDFSVSLGQGLACWTGFGMGKGPATTNIQRYAPALRAYSSVGEALFLRGAAATFKLGKRFEFTAFGSYRPRDANLTTQLDTINVSQDDAISAFQESGFHRTENEIADRNAINEMVTGGSLKWKNRFFRLGANTVYTLLSSPLVRTPQLYSKYYFSGDNLLNVSIDYSVFYRGFNFFGETAMSDNGAIATLNGVQVNLDGQIGFSLLHRYFDKKYQTIWGSAFSEGSQINNESGLYLGATFEPLPRVKVAAYADVYRFPWLKYSVDGPSNGHDIYLRVDYSRSRYSFYVQLRDETKGRNRPDNPELDIDIDPHLDHIIPVRKTSLRLHANFILSPEFELRGRAEWVRYHDTETSKGLLLYQDIIWKPKKLPITVQGRLAIYQTDDYNSKIYAYESDVLYAFSIPAMYGRGLRTYLNVRYSVNRDITLWFRLAHTYFDDQPSNGSGLDLINGRTRTEAKVQLRYEF